MRLVSVYQVAVVTCVPLLVMRILVFFIRHVDHSNLASDNGGMNETAILLAAAIKGETYESVQDRSSGW